MYIIFVSQLVSPEPKEVTESADYKKKEKEI